MAIRLDKAFGGGAETWLRLQVAYDLAKAQKYPDKINVRSADASLLSAELEGGAVPAQPGEAGAPVPA